MKGLSLKISIGALILVLAVLLSAACAEDDYPGAAKSSQGRIQITADRIKIVSERDATEHVFDGKVTIKQDNLVIAHAGKKRSRTLPGGAIKSITASGNVKITQNKRRATAEKAVWDHAKQTITLTGGPPRLWQGRDSMSGHRIIMRLDENYAAIDYGGAPDLMPRPQKKEK